MASSGHDPDGNSEEAAGSADGDYPVLWVNASGEKPDLEKAVTLRSIVIPIIDQAESWTALIDALEARNFGLAIQGGRLVLTDRNTGMRICTGRFLGKPLAALVARMGKPHVRPSLSREDHGELLREPSSWRR